MRPWVLLVAVAMGILVVVGVLVATGGDDGPPPRAVAGVAGVQDPQPPAPYTGPGSFRIWVTNSDGSAVRWDPCTPIPWVLLADGAPAGALGDLQTAFSMLGDATGLTFTYEGTTDEIPSRERAPFQPDRWGSDRWAPVLIAWVPPLTGGLDLTDNDRAVTVPVSVDEGRGGVFVSGQVVFNRDRTLQSGFITRQSHWGGTILHELGHLAGLDHVDDEGELMYPRPGLGPPFFGPGDLAGLARLGSDLDCLVQPEPQDLEVGFRS